MAVVTELLSHLVVAGVEAARIVVPGVGQSLIHQLVAVAVAVHLGPVVLGGGRQAAQGSHGRGWVGGAGGHDGRPLVGPVRVLLHVLGQVRLLGVGLAAVRTDVSLQVLGLLVLRYVVQQGRLVMEALVAGVTLVGLVRLVTPGVGLQVGQLGEGLGAA